MSKTLNSDPLLWASYNSKVWSPKSISETFPGNTWWSPVAFICCCIIFSFCCLKLFSENRDLCFPLKVTIQIKTNESSKFSQRNVVAADSYGILIPDESYSIPVIVKILHFYCWKSYFFVSKISWGSFESNFWELSLIKDRLGASSGRRR